MANALSRFQVIPANRLIAPGKCAVCGCISGDFVDFGFDLDFYGVVYFCKDNCFREAAEQLDYLPAGMFKKMTDVLAAHKAIVLDLENENKELRNALGIIEHVRSNKLDPDQLVLDFDEQSAESSEDAGEGDKSTDGSESGPSESANESGPSGVRDNEDPVDPFATSI